jgi:sugar O-acyltransferase (sialic acid O-acetyltransferase NeuD family)
VNGNFREHVRKHWAVSASRLVIFGVGAPLTVDVEETCARLGVELAAGVRNVPGPSFASDALTIVDAEQVPAGLKALGVVLPMFTPAHRLAALAHAMRMGFLRAETVVDPTSVVARSARIGRGVYINAGCTIAGAVQLGDFAFVNRAASIGHHSRLGDFTSIGPGAVLTGGIVVGRGAMVGAGAVLLPELEIGANAMVGAGSVVTRSVPANSLAVGNPAQVVRHDLPSLADTPSLPRS